MADITKAYPALWVVTIFGICLQLVATILIFVTAGKDPATIPMREFLY
jgi:type IV secretory pathway TrbD component